MLNFLIQFFIIILTLVNFQFHFVFGQNYHQLHREMNENELQFYFGAKSVKTQIPKYEIVKIRTFSKRDISGNSSIDFYLQFNAFERKIRLKLKESKQLISPWFESWVITEQGKREIISGDYQKNCYFSHFDEIFVAAFNNCDEKKFAGFITTGSEIFELQPVNARLMEILKNNNSIFDGNIGSYLIKKLTLKDDFSPSLNLSQKKRSIVIEDKNNSINLKKNMSISFKAPSMILESFIENKKPSELTIEVGLFFDEAAYQIFAPFFNFDDRKLTEMLLAYMNGVQVLYHHSSLGIPIDITIVHMEIMQNQSKFLPTYNGERGELLDSFCSYQRRINPPEDNSPNHWDMALYISGLDFYGIEKGVKSSATMGLAPVGGVCTEIYNCVIAEFGVKNSFRRPYPSAGFTSVFILAHEIGHNLGMLHDSLGNYCSKDGFIMSPSRGTQGETTWSSCSANIIQDLSSWADCLKDRPLDNPTDYDTWKLFSGYPGQIWSAKKQCELLLVDEDSIESPTISIQDICENLQCRSPHRSGYFFAGPALEGTNCGNNNWCEGGHCSPKKLLIIPQSITKGGWSPWKLTDEKCISDCILNSKGSQNRRRTCTNPIPVNTTEGCDGPSYDVILCDDNEICKSSKRKSSISYASKRCKEFSDIVTDLDPKGIGIQASHETMRLWVGCAIFCKRKNSKIFYTPRFELNDLRIDAYFPDGTLCHINKNEKFYCLQHHCLPEGFQFNKNNLFLLSEDVPISGNANPKPMDYMNSKLRDYLSLDLNGKPILEHIEIEDIMEYQINEKWIDDDEDFRIVPGLRKINKGQF